MTALATTLQSSRPGEYVSLFRIDTTSIGGPVMFFTQNSREDGARIKFGGIEYTPADIEFSGFEVNGNGSLPTPKISLANTDGVIQDIVNTYGDLAGCPIARVRTFGRYLDGQPDADPGKYVGPDIFRVERKTSETDERIEWELAASIDQEGKKLPGRLVLNDYCPWRYRSFDMRTGKFVYPTGTRSCPYAGTKMFDRLDNAVTDSAKDECSQTYQGCRLRYGPGAALPFGGFLGVAKVKI